MTRRRLRIHYSSSDSDDDRHPSPPSPPPPPPQPQPQPPIQIPEQEDISDEYLIDVSDNLNFQSVSLNPQNPNSNPIHINASDDEEFIDVPNNLSPPNLSPHYLSPPSMMDTSLPSSPGTSGSTYFEASDCPIGGFLSGLGLRVRSDWLSACVRGLEGSVSGFGNLGVAEKAKLCFGQFLFSDMNNLGAGVLPDNVQGLHLVDLPGPFVLQVDEIVNLSCPLKGRYQAANPGLKRCLKLSMTDGVQRLFGMEYRPIKDLEVLAPAGLKIVIQNVHIRRGILMLVPEVVKILGGLVEDLEAARQKLVQEVNKPPRGKRTRNGVVPPLANRATQAAWPPNGVSAPGPTNVTTAQSAARPRATELARSPGSSTRERTNQESAVPRNTADLDPEPNISTPVVNRRANLEPTLSSTVENRRASLEPNISPTLENRRANLVPTLSSTVENRRVNVEPNLSSACENSRDNFKSDIPSYADDRRASVESNLFSNAGNSRTNFEPPMSFTAENSMVNDETNRSFTPRNSSASVEPNLPSVDILDIEDIHSVDEVDHSSILGGDREFPFTYIASLSAKLAVANNKASCVQGTIKCFLTAVKGFQWKQREKFELRAFIDDGSLISEIFIDHNVVLDKLGHSPREVTSALFSKDPKRVEEMKEILTKFQLFLVNFEGTMIVQISEGSPFPTALEMRQGCSTSDAWLLLRRLKSSHVNPHQQQSAIETIDLSP